MSDTLDRRTPPAPGAIRPFDFPEVRSTEVATGLDLRISHLPHVPLVSVVAVLAAGESSVPPGREGLAVLTADALEGGTAERPGAELAEALESMGASCYGTAGWDATTVSLSCLADRLPQAIHIMSEVMVDSTFPGAEVVRLRDQQLARIRQRAEDPSALANDWAVRLMYGDGVAYGRPLGGTRASVGSLGKGEVSRWAREAYVSGGGGLVIVGDVDMQQASTLVESAFGSWNGEPLPRPAVPDLPRFEGRTVHVVHRPGAAQSELRIGHPGVARGHVDYFPLVVANTSLGGAFTSRLNLNLRERQGFTYGVRSRFSFRRGPGPFQVSTAVGSDVTAPAVYEILSELTTFVEKGPTEAEVASSRDFITGVFPLRLETTSQVAGRIAELFVFGLPDDHYARYRDRIRAVTVESARDASALHIRPARATIVVVGDADVVSGPLGQLGFGPLEVVESELDRGGGLA